MNLILLEDSDFLSEYRATLTGRRLKHLIEVQKINTGDTVNAGRINGKMGTAKVLDIATETVTLNVNLTERPPAPLPLTLILALPRPKMLRRIF